MRLEILCQDRLGMTQEILNIIVHKGWDLTAMEMVSQKIFVHLDEQGTSFDDICAALKTINGVKEVIKVDLLPSELKRKHLDTLLSKLPDPIVDIDINGEIMVANRAAELVFELGDTGSEKNVNNTFNNTFNHNGLIGLNFSQLINESLVRLLPSEQTSFEVSCGKKQYLMDITPVSTHGKTTGAVIVLRSPQ